MLLNLAELQVKLVVKSVIQGDVSRESLKSYEETMKKAIGSKIAAAIKVQYRWLNLSDQEWDKEIEIIDELSAEEFLDFIKADFGMVSMLKLATHHPKLAFHQLFQIIKNTEKIKRYENSKNCSLLVLQVE